MTDCVITIDARGFQKRIAADIIQGKGDYVLALKENHPEVYSEVAALVPGNEPEYAELTKDHGRIEKQEAWLYTDWSWFSGLKDWEGLKAFGCIRSSRTIKEVTAIEYRYFLTSLNNTAHFARPVRTHWGGIENKLHWTMDVVFREDYARNRKEHSAANLAVLRKITLNLIRRILQRNMRSKSFSQPQTSLCLLKSRFPVQNLMQFIMRLPCRYIDRQLQIDQFSE